MLPTSANRRTASRLNWTRQQFRTFKLYVTLTLGLPLLINCSGSDFSPGISAKGNTSSGTSQGSSGGPGTITNPVTTLAANDIKLATTIGTTLTFTAADILAANSAPAGQTLTLASVGEPSDSSQLSRTADTFSLVPAAVGSSRLSYSITDTKGDTASATITISVLNSGSVTGYFYACNKASQIFVINPIMDTIQSFLTSTFNGKNIVFNDLAIDSSGLLYGKDYSNNIYTVDATTGNATLTLSQVMDPTVYSAFGLTILPSGDWVTARQNVRTNAFAVIQISAKTKAITELVPESAGYNMNAGAGNVGGDIKALPDGYLYWTVSNSSSKLCAQSNGSGNQAIVRIDPVTKLTSEISCLNQANIYGLGYAQKSLFGFSGNGALIQINLANGTATTMSQTNQSFIGATSNPTLW